nr:MAG TPA: IlvGEDA operon leader peptide [Caudoviricetes sp.]
MKGILKHSLRRIGNPPCGAGLPMGVFYSLLQLYVI